MKFIRNVLLLTFVAMIGAIVFVGYRFFLTKNNLSQITSSYIPNLASVQSTPSQDEIMLGNFSTETSSQSHEKPLLYYLKAQGNTRNFSLLRTNKLLNFREEANIKSSGVNLYGIQTLRSNSWDQLLVFFNNSIVSLSDEDPQVINSFKDINLINKSNQGYILSTDGLKIAFLKITYVERSSGSDNVYHIADLYVLNTETKKIEKVGENLNEAINLGTPFTLYPIGWSADDSEIYLVPTVDAEATPKGIYVFDLATRKIRLLPHSETVPAFSVKISSDHKKIAFTQNEWRQVANEMMPRTVPPFVAGYFDMKSEVKHSLINSQTEGPWSSPVWSPSDAKIALSNPKGIYTVDVESKVPTLIVPLRFGKILEPVKWMDDTTLVYIEKDNSSTGREYEERLYIVDLAKKEKKLVDTGASFNVLGVIK